MSSNTTVESSERNSSLVVNDLVQVFNGLSQFVSLKSHGSFTGVLFELILETVKSSSTSDSKGKGNVLANNTREG